MVVPLLRSCDVDVSLALYFHATLSVVSYRCVNRMVERFFDSFFPLANLSLFAFSYYFFMLLPHFSLSLMISYVLLYYYLLSESILFVIARAREKK